LEIIGKLPPLPKDLVVRKERIARRLKADQRREKGEIAFLEELDKSPVRTGPDFMTMTTAPSVLMGRPFGF